MQSRVRFPSLVLLALSVFACTTASAPGQDENLRSQLGANVQDTSSDTTAGMEAEDPSRDEYAPPFEEDNLGGLAMSRPCCVATAPGRIDCFHRGRRSDVQQMTIQQGVPREWTSIEGMATSDIECSSPQEGHINVFVLGTSKDVASRAFDSQSWEEWTSAGFQAVEVPTCVWRSGSFAECVFRDELNDGYRISFRDGLWGNSYSLRTWTREIVALQQPFGCGENLDSEECDPVLRTRECNFICFTVNPDGNVMAVNRRYDLWGLIILGVNARLNGRPSVVYSSVNGWHVVGLGSENDVVDLQSQSIDFDFEVESLGGVFDTDPYCLAIGEAIHCFAVGTDSQLYYAGWNLQNLQLSRKWSAWTKCNGASDFYTGPPQCISTDGDEISCFVRNTKREVVRFAFSLEAQPDVAPVSENIST